MNGLNSSQVNGMPAKVPRQAVGHNDKKASLWTGSILPEAQGMMIKITEPVAVHTAIYCCLLSDRCGEIECCSLFSSV
jgi:hypothetical protein